jgi:hypothetical protein
LTDFGVAAAQTRSTDRETEAVTTMLAANGSWLWTILLAFARGDARLLAGASAVTAN